MKKPLNPLALQFSEMSCRSILAGSLIVFCVAIVSTRAANKITGQWDFEHANLAATFGADLAYLDNSVASVYQFGTTGIGDFAGIPSIDGNPGKILLIPYTSNFDVPPFQSLGLKMTHDIAPNGGGLNVNQWTLIMDIFWGDGSINGAVLKTHDFDQIIDSDLFWSVVSEDYGKSCCSPYFGPVDPLAAQPRYQWSRVVFAADLTKSDRLNNVSPG